MMFVCDHDAKILAFGVLALGVFVSNAGFVCFPQISQMDADFLPLAPCLLPLFCFPQISQIGADFFVSDFRFQISVSRRLRRWTQIFLPALVRNFRRIRAEISLPTCGERKEKGAYPQGQRPCGTQRRASPCGQRQGAGNHPRLSAKSAGNKTEARGKEQEARNPRQSAKSAGNRNLKSEICHPHAGRRRLGPSSTTWVNISRMRSRMMGP